MSKFNYRQWLYFSIFQLRGVPVGRYYKQFLKDVQSGIPVETSNNLLIRLLSHCNHSVPYYAKIIQSLGDYYLKDPEEYLKHFPVLTKDDIRNNFDDLKAVDLSKRHWFHNTSGGSTGDPVRFIQDRYYSARSGGIGLLFSKLIGREVGEYEVRLWGSVRDLKRNSDGWRAQLINVVNNRTLVNSVLLTRDRILEIIHLLNTKKPKILVSYVEPLYEIAKYIERENIPVIPQNAIMTAAGKLYPFMRDKIERVFQCRVYDNYGSREVGGIACEYPGSKGLWVAPWGNFVEIVDEQGNRLPDGNEGNILITSLSNFAMPLIRYRIEDRGILLPQQSNSIRDYGQVLQEVTGRTIDIFITKNETLFNPGYLMANLYYRDWIKRYQIIQKSYSHVVYKIVTTDNESPTNELEEIISVTKSAMGEDCQVDFDFVDDIQLSKSGKYCYLKSEVKAGQSNQYNPEE
jgi:phenylacetate-CoA ligase